MTRTRSIWPAGPQGGRWHSAVVAQTGSTNDDLTAAAERGELAHRTVLRAEHQTSGRGRLDRRWDAPPGSNLLASIYFEEVDGRPGETVQRIGVAIVEAISELAAGRASATDLARLGLKWPNDVLLDGRKLAGVLAQRTSSARGVVVGFGVNVGWAPERGARVGDLVECAPAEVLAAVLTAVDRLPADHEQFAAHYRRRLLTLGQPVRMHLPGDSTFDGIATDLDADGRLTVRSADGTVRTFDVGDVVHLRPRPGGTLG